MSGQARPHVFLKLATSLDGRIATAGGESRWITGDAARAEVHRLRASADAVVIGSETALADDPELTARTSPPPPRQPARIVADGRLRLSPASRLAMSTELGAVICATRGGSPEARQLLRDLGVEIWELPPAPDGAGISVAALLERCSLAGMKVLMVEGGGRLAAAFLAAGMVDRIEWFRAPVVLGDDGRAGVGALGLARLGDAPRFRRIAFEAVGDDLWERYVRTSED